MISFRTAAPEEFETVRDFYWNVIDGMENAEYRPGWIKGVYPEDEYLQDSLQNRELWLMEEDGATIGAMVLNRSCNEEYTQAPWKVSAPPERVSVIHTLCVRPDLGRRGLGKRMVGHALKTAKERGDLAVRLDVILGNLPAEKLYTSMGFEYITQLELFYEDTGRFGFKLYECPLGGQA